MGFFFHSTECSLLLSRKLMGKAILTLSGARSPVLELVYQSLLMEEVTTLLYNLVDNVPFSMVEKLLCVHYIHLEYRNFERIEWFISKIAAM